VTVNPSIDNERGGHDSGIPPRCRKVPGKQRQLESARNVEHINLFGRNKLAKASDRLVYDFSVPVGFDEGIAGGCHVISFVATRHPRRSRAILLSERDTSNHPFSFIRTITVGSGISPDLLDPSKGRRSRARN
jgi:hypothetical protein